MPHSPIELNDAVLKVFKHRNLHSLATCAAVRGPTFSSTDFITFFTQMHLISETLAFSIYSSMDHLTKHRVFVAKWAYVHVTCAHLPETTSTTVSMTLWHTLAVLRRHAADIVK